MRECQKLRDLSPCGVSQQRKQTKTCWEILRVQLEFANFPKTAIYVRRGQNMLLVTISPCTSSSSCSASTVRGSSSNVSRETRATMGDVCKRKRCASSSREQETADASRASSVVGSVSPGNDPPPIVDSPCCVCTLIPSALSLATHAAARVTSSSGRAALIRQTGIGVSSSPRSYWRNG